MSAPWETLRAEIEACFCDENLTETEEELSPSGRFRLILREYSIREGAWHYSRGTVVRVSDGREVCDIRRNYPHFPRSWLVKEGAEWLVAGRSYMSQTIVDLETGEAYEPPGDPYQSDAFCWVGCQLSPDGNTLLVDGCIWACPYELRFFDFTDPRRGWPELPMATDEPIESDHRRAPEWIDAATVDCFQTGEEGELRAKTRLRREGPQMVTVDVWVSEAEQARRQAEALAEEADQAWRRRFEAEDPIFLAMREAVAASGLPDDWTCYSRSETPDGNRDVVRYFRGGVPGRSGDLRWGTQAGPIHVTLYDDAGNQAEELELERSVVGMRQAIGRIAERFVER